MEQQSRPLSSVAARNPGAFRVMGPPGTLSVPESFMSTPPPYPGPKANGSRVQQTYTSLLQAEREVEILNHCFDDIEFFMGKLQKSAEAHSVLNQRKKKKSRRKKEEEDDLLTLRARPPPEEEFRDIFQKFKYSFSLLDRLKSSITNPNSEELLHHIFIPLDLIVKTTGGPALGAGVSSPALTGGAVTLLQGSLNEEEKHLWTALGPNWTLSGSQLSQTASPYTPVFLDGWNPPAFDREGQLWEDPIELQQKQEVLNQRQTEAESAALHKHPGQSSDEMDSSNLPPEGERQFCCSYDFVARNSSELSVLQGETLEVIESSKRWWKCRNRYDQIGFVPFNILEPLSAVNDAHKASALSHTPPKKGPLSPLMNKGFYYNPPSPSNISRSPQHQSAPGTPTAEDGDRVMAVNDELLQRLTNGRAGSPHPLVIPRTNDTSAPLNYHSPPSEVGEWLRGKGFNESTVGCLRVLTGAQLFSLNKEELRAVSPEEGARVYSQIMVQKALLEDVRKATELEAVMEKQKMKVDLKMESSTL